MKLVEMKCSSCGAKLKVPEGQKDVICQFCGAQFKVDDEIIHHKVEDAEDLGYRMEKGRMRAQREEAEAQAKAATEEQSIRQAQNEAAAKQFSVEIAQKEAYEKRKENAIIKIIITIFLGGFGVHKFMEHKIGMGFLYLFTYGLLGIGVLIDTIKAIMELVRINEEVH